MLYREVKVRGKVARALRRLSDYKPSNHREYGRSPNFQIWYKDDKRRMYKIMKKKYKELYNALHRSDE